MRDAPGSVAAILGHIFLRITRKHVAVGLGRKLPSGAFPAMHDLERALDRLLFGEIGTVS